MADDFDALDGLLYEMTDGIVALKYWQSQKISTFPSCWQKQKQPSIDSIITEAVAAMDFKVEYSKEKPTQAAMNAVFKKSSRRQRAIDAFRDIKRPPPAHFPSEE